MRTSGVNEPSKRTARSHTASISWLMTAGGLFLVSAVLQHIASVQRWLVFSASQTGDDISVEDHLFDYYFIGEPWVQIGTTAEFLGAGIVVQAVGVLAMTAGVLTQPSSMAPRHVIITVLTTIAEIVLAILVAASFGIHGTYALHSGITGIPSLPQNWFTLSFVGFAGLVALAVLWRRRVPAAMAACMFLLGATALGYLLASYVVAPVVVGSTSHDTTPWTETVVATSTAAASIATLFAAWVAAKRGRHPAPS